MGKKTNWFEEEKKAGKNCCKCGSGGTGSIPAGSGTELGHILSTSCHSCWGKKKDERKRVVDSPSAVSEDHWVQAVYERIDIYKKRPCESVKVKPGLW